MGGISYDGINNVNCYPLSLISANTFSLRLFLVDFFVWLTNSIEYIFFRNAANFHLVQNMTAENHMIEAEHWNGQKLGTIVAPPSVTALVRHSSTLQFRIKRIGPECKLATYPKAGAKSKKNKRDCSVFRDKRALMRQLRDCSERATLPRRGLLCGASDKSVLARLTDSARQVSDSLPTSGTRPRFARTTTCV
jgi:hypothetical protein